MRRTKRKIRTTFQVKQRSKKSRAKKIQQRHDTERRLLWLFLGIVIVLSLLALYFYLPKVISFFWQSLHLNFLLLLIFLVLSPFLLWKVPKFRLRIFMICVVSLLTIFLLVAKIFPGSWNEAIASNLGWGLYLLMILPPLMLAFFILFVLRRKPVLRRPPQLVTPELQGGVNKTESAKVAKEKPVFAPSKTGGTSGHDYSLPPLDLLRRPQGEQKITRRETRNVSQLLLDKLRSFGIGAQVVNIEVGPAITRYELQLDSGVKVSKVLSLADDIALALAATGIRMEAPVPNKPVLGIEVPSEKISTVSLREIVESDEFQRKRTKLPLALGKDISGHPVVGDLREMPHLLVAGATGSGKSVCINAMICGVLFRATPDDVNFILIDPKRVELFSYRQLPHLLYPLVMDTKQAAAVLKEVVKEMEQRLALFSESGARDIEAYNLKGRENGRSKNLPYLVVVIDELADLMMIAPAEVEQNICRLAQLARATGIHLIVVTQRPSADIITGLIKANIPSRISFAVASMMDSRVILDMGGAEKLLGRGDMLFHPVGYPKPARLQGAYVTDSEIDHLVDFWRNQSKDLILRRPLPSQVESDEEEEESSDPLYEEAVRLVIQAREGSASMLQRKLKIGYARAGRLIDLMEKQGIVGPAVGSKPRPVLRFPDQSSFKFK